MEENTNITGEGIEEMEDMEQDDTVGALCESIETNMWLADAYSLRGAKGLAVECLRAAWMEYVRFGDILKVYAGDGLRERLIRALVNAGDAGAVAGLPELAEVALH